ncbi:TetR/AcrR family transcriptional regulator [Sporosarcina sp. FA9]|uniref:TetR/AcrR family transcriptional regulator n=1 Tax=Sporosarcina sp. FA9 TaxID=3413030 RepID=UPI003F66078A
MTKRKILIIEKASELFAENGFNATSVQDITDACGISKGAFYLSFKSKDSLLFSIFEYFSSKLMNRMSGISDYKVNSKERLVLFFSIQFEEIARYSDFILMHMREQTNPINKEMMGIVNEMRQKTYEMQENLLIDVYGEEIQQHMPDLLVLLSGVVKGYIEIIVFNKDVLDYDGLARFIVERTDSLVMGLSEPFLKSEQLVGYNRVGSDLLITTKMLIKDIELLKLEITDDDLLVSLDVIQLELSLQEYRKPVLTGMMSNLENHVVTEKVLLKMKLFLGM